MTDRHDADPREQPHLASLLSDGAVWEETDPGLEDAVVAAVTAEASGRDGPPADPVAPFRSPAWRQWIAPFASGAAAALLAVILLTALFDDDAADAPAGVAVAMAGTERSPDASAVATVTDTPAGTRIDLDVTGLPPAPQGSYYEAWMWDEEGDGISAGSFHLRGGDSSIELWAGVPLDDYPRMTVTLESEDDGPEPSGEVVLRGEQ